MRPAETNQPYNDEDASIISPRKEKEHTHVITGTNKKKRLRQCLAIYAFGSSTPMAKTPIASTIRVNSRVIVSVTCSGFAVLHARGSKMPAQYGPFVDNLDDEIKAKSIARDIPMIIPKRNAQMASPMYSYLKGKVVMRSNG